MKKILNWVVPIILGVIIGVLTGLYQRGAAHAAVELRPNLPEMGYIAAVMANHGGDWLWYHYPDGMMVFNVVFFIIFSVIVWRIS